MKNLRFCHNLDPYLEVFKENKKKNNPKLQTILPKYYKQLFNDSIYSSFRKLYLWG